QDFEGCNLDPKFYRNDLSLFGYKNLTDWFGPTFVEKIAEVILHGAALAKQRGYAVFRDEVVTDLMMRCHAITDANKGQIQMNGSEFYYAALKRMQLSEESLISIWKNVLLFRRLMQDVGNGVWMDTTPLDEFFGYAGECAIVEVYSLPSPFCFTTMAQWQEFETYLDLVGEKRDETLLPIAMIPLHQVEEKAPELISSKYTVFIATAEKKALEAKIGLKQMWKWESSFEGWEAIIQRFPDLREIEAPTQEARLEALDGLGDKMRALIDRFAREEIVNAHPEWLTELLAQSESTRRVFYFRKGQTASPLDGITDVAAFVKAIESSDTEKVEGYTQDKKIYFNLKLEEKGEKKVLSFVEASKEGVLSEILEKKLRGHYLDLREKAPSVLQTETGKFRPFSECKEIVANHYFTSTHHALEKYKLWTPTQAWFLPYLEHKKNQILAGIEEEGTFEWSLSKKTETITRATPGFVTLEECQALEEGDFSEISVSSKEGPYFYKVIDQRRDASFPLSSLLKIESVLANELKTHFIEDLLKKIQTKEMNFISQ
ncbi:MAG: hypothetical protein KDK55_07050, partial [Chlamydiia bacterium]|nr:hypothetical protein [Chlamydiia bacterium]